MTVGPTTRYRAPMPSAARRSVAILFLLCSGACGYLRDRAHDLLDPFRVDVGYGLGLYADVRATDWLAAGAGLHRVHHAGLHGRFVGTSTLGQVGFPLTMLGEPTFTMTPLLGGGSQFDWERDIVPGQLFLVVPAMHAGRTGISAWSLAKRDVRVADVGASLTLGVVGVSLGFSPGEVLDLLLGVVGIDLAGDDDASRPPLLPADAATPSDPEPVESRTR